MKPNGMKRLIAVFMVLALMSSGVTVCAEETEEKSEIEVMSDEVAAKKIGTTSPTSQLEELVPERIEAIEYNNLERNIFNDENIILEQEDGIKTFDEGDNTDPAYAVTIGTSSIHNGSISNAGEMRWYNFQVTSKAKRTIKLQMENTLDADIYLFQYDSGQLTLVGGSANPGAGVEENTNDILEAGIYFIAIGGYEGSGNYAFLFTGTDVDINYEPNDTFEQATQISTNTAIDGVIDGPYDRDYYSISLSAPTAISYNITNPNGKNYQLLYAGGSTGYQLENRASDDTGKEPVILNSGTHYFAVVSGDESFDPINAYQITITAHTEVASVYNCPNFVYNERANVFFQFNSARTSYYINGKPIDFTYNYSYHSSGGGGSQSVDIGLKKTPDFNVCLTQKEGTDAGIQLQQSVPDILWYSSNFANISGKYVIMLSVNDWNNKCYYIHALSTGDYYPDRLYADLNCANVIIDPDTGKVIDIMWYNYYYEVGNFSCNFSRLPAKFNYAYWNGEEPKSKN